MRVEVLHDDVAVVAEVLLLRFGQGGVPLEYLDGRLASPRDNLPAADFDLRHLKGELCVAWLRKNDLAVGAILAEEYVADGAEPREEAVEVARQKLLAAVDAKIGVRLPAKQEHIGWYALRSGALDLGQARVSLREPLGLSPAEDAIPVQHERALLVY